MTAKILEFPAERTQRYREERVAAAWHVYEDALRAWHAAQGTPLPPDPKEDSQ